MRTFAMTLALLVSGTAFAGSSLHNADAKHTILYADSDSCFSGTHSSIESNTTTEVSAGKYICVDEHMPGVLVEDGHKYEIKGGVVVAQ